MGGKLSFFKKASLDIQQIQPSEEEQVVNKSDDKSAEVNGDQSTDTHECKCNPCKCDPCKCADKTNEQLKQQSPESNAQLSQEKSESTEVIAESSKVNTESNEVKTESNEVKTESNEIKTESIDDKPVVNELDSEVSNNEPQKDLVQDSEPILAETAKENDNEKGEEPVEGKKCWCDPCKCDPCNCTTAQVVEKESENTESHEGSNVSQPNNEVANDEPHKDPNQESEAVLAETTEQSHELNQELVNPSN